MKNNLQNHECIIVGLDIGTTKTSMIVGKRNEFGKIEVLGYGHAVSKGMKQAEVVNIADISNSIREALKKCYASNKQIKEIKEVIVGIAGKHIASKVHSGNLIRQDGDVEITRDEIEMLRIQQYDNYIEAGDEIINVIPKYYQIDNKYNVLDQDIVGCVGKRIDGYFNVITGNKEEIKKICKAVEKAGLKIREIYLQPLASALSILTKDLKKAGVVIADLGGGTTDIAVFQEGTLIHTAVIDMAGNFITENIYRGLNLFREEEAEELKIKFGSCVPDMVKQNAHITLTGEKGMNPPRISVFQLSSNIAYSVREIIKHINQNLINNGINPKTIRGGIYLTGGTASLTHLQQLISFETKLDAKLGLPTTHLSNIKYKKLIGPENSTCYGLILYGFELYDKFKHLEQYKSPIEMFEMEQNILNSQAKNQMLNNSNHHFDDKSTQLKEPENLMSNSAQLHHEPQLEKKKNFISLFREFINTVSNEFKSPDEKFD